MDAAREAGADAVKFQSFLADLLVSKDSPDHALLKRLEVPRDWYPRLREEATARGLVFFSTATNEITLGWLKEVGVELYKIASPNLTHLPLIRNTASIGRPVILSTGMATTGQIDEAVEAARAAGNTMLCLLHCVSEYPAEPRRINLRFIKTLDILYPYPIGFSDHTLGIATSIGAVALGARVIEKHMTLDRHSSGPDHHFSLEPGDFRRLVDGIRTVDVALGEGRKTISPGERDKSASYWRSLHAARPIAAGAVLSAGDLAVVRPNDGLHPRHLEDVVGLRVARALEPGAPITWACFRPSDDD